MLACACLLACLLKPSHEYLVSPHETRAMIFLIATSSSGLTYRRHRNGLFSVPLSFRSSLISCIYDKVVVYQIIPSRLCVGYIMCLMSVLSETLVTCHLSRSRSMGRLDNTLCQVHSVPRMNHLSLIGVSQHLRLFLIHPKQFRESVSKMILGRCSKA